MKLILCGDIVPTAVTVPAFDASDLNALMGDALDVLRSGDFTVGNLECALTNGEERIRKCGPHLKGRPEYAKVLHECGFTHLGLSNNHAMDYGIPGFRDTVSALVDAGITPFGYGENDQDSRRALYLTKDGLTVAIVAVCEHEYSYALPNRFGANPFDPFDTMDDIRNARAHSDRVVVMYHGGKEQCEVPSPRLRKACPRDDPRRRRPRAHAAQPLHRLPRIVWGRRNPIRTGQFQFCRPYRITRTGTVA